MSCLRKMPNFDRIMETINVWRSLYRLFTDLGCKTGTSQMLQGNKNNNSSNSYIFGPRPQTTIIIGVAVIAYQSFQVFKSKPLEVYFIDQPFQPSLSFASCWPFLPLPRCIGFRPRPASSSPSRCSITSTRSHKRFLIILPHYKI